LSGMLSAGPSARVGNDSRQRTNRTQGVCLDTAAFVSGKALAAGFVIE
jgi:hypothetical protein